MQTLTLHRPDSLDMTAKEVTMLLAARLYEQGKLSLGQAAELAGLSKPAFAEALGHQGVSVFNLPARGHRAGRGQCLSASSPTLAAWLPAPGPATWLKPAFLKKCRRPKAWPAARCIFSGAPKRWPAAFLRIFGAPQAGPGVRCIFFWAPPASASAC